ncbi:MAG TPA: alpha/beta hydrolase-fold protein [Cyclobacteriaceae bacterium]|nr:alpha/beta hydrolase-fold protein [Cyclobacteriaceae bacterium]
MRPAVTYVLLLFATQAYPQDYSLLRKVREELRTISAMPDTSARKAELDKWWNHLIEQKLIPLAVEDSAIFFYRGEAKTVTWTGDFNAWGYVRDYKSKGTRVPGTDVWLLKASFPKDARLDYKIVVNNSDRILDPENPFQQWSGLGGGSPNSELRMPAWREDPILKPIPGIPHGTLRKDILFSSKTLRYQITYSVYQPAGAEHGKKLPVLYVMDGHEYLLPELGNMATILDNLIGEKKIEPIIVVLVDHREPANRSNNRRMEELNMSAKYLNFFTNEFMPAIEKKYPIQAEAAHRAILGSSIGGLTSAYFIFSRPDLFSMAGMQSPAFWSRPQIYSLCDSATKANLPKMKISLSSGLINDASEGSRKIKDILQNSACVYHYRETNEGSSWGNWRNSIDDVLLDLFGSNNR